MESYFKRQRDYLFRNVSVLIYVFDVESNEYKKDMQFYRDAMEALQEHSPEAKIFVLIHKMDLLPEEQGDKVTVNIIFIYLSIYLYICMYKESG
tara:strand:+ start:541 stop:822 length:282 start_codon:yes stop_codon:yes gene_type:complete